MPDYRVVVKIAGATGQAKQVLAQLQALAGVEVTHVMKGAPAHPSAPRPDGSQRPAKGVRWSPTEELQ